MEIVSKWWMLIDSCSSTTLFCNQDLFSNIRSAGPHEQISLFSDTGSQIYDQVGDVKYPPLVAHYNSAGIANVISMKDIDLKAGYYMTMNTKAEIGIRLHTPDGNSLLFKRCREGLHYLHVRHLEVKNSDKHNTTVIGYYLAQHKSIPPLHDHTVNIFLSMKKLRVKRLVPCLVLNSQPLIQ